MTDQFDPVRFAILSALADELDETGSNYAGALIALSVRDPELSAIWKKDAGIVQSRTELAMVRIKALQEIELKKSK